MNFPFDPDGADPRMVPTRMLSSEASIPAIGLGTFGSDLVSVESVADAVHGVASDGYRQFDCASLYENESEIGGVFEEMLNDGLVRDELWVTSKLWNDKHGVDDVIPAFEKSLSDLRLDYLDLYLIHWPFPHSHPQGSDVELMEELVERLVPWRLHPEELVTHRFALDAVDKAYELMSAGRCGQVAVCFDESLEVV